MTEDEKLLRVLKQEEADSTSYYSSELAEVQGEALQRYFAEPYGDELPDRSKLTTHDVADTIDWLLPDLMRVFVGSDDMLEVDAIRASDEKDEEDIKTYIQHVFFQDNDGESLVHDFLFDGLLQRVGVISVDWEDGKKQPPRVWEGVSLDRIQEILADPEYDILEQAERIETTELGPMPLFDLKVQRKPHGRCIVECCPPEQFRISRRATSIDGSDYVAKHKKTYLNELAKKFPKKAASLQALTGSSSADTVEIDADPRIEARFEDEASTEYRLSDHEQERRKVVLMEEFIRYDFDGDGVVEWRRVKRVENVILENEQSDGPNMALWSPIPVSHKAIGRSIADRVIDIQRTRTVLTRNFMDNLALVSEPTAFANESALGEGALDMMLDHVIGAVVPTKAPPSDVVQWQTVPDVTPSIHQGLEYWDQQSEVRSGVNRHSQGLDPDALNKTATGIDLLQTASSARKEFIARQAAKGLVEALKLVLKCLCAHQDSARQIKVNGKFTSFDPRRWSDDCTLQLHVGQGIATRERRLINLNMIAQKQEQILAQSSENPLVGVKEYETTLTSIVEEMGYRDTTRFIKEIPDDYQEPEQPPQEDPAVIKAKGDIELQQAKQAQAAQIAEESLIAEQSRKDAELQADMDRKERQLAMEMDLKERQVAAELAIAREAGIAKIATSDVQPGGDPG